MKVQTIEKDGKPEYVVLPWADYAALLERLEALEDIADADAVHAALARGDEEAIPAAVAARLIAGEAPLKVWRVHRGLSQAALAKAAGIAQSMVAMIERGERGGGVETLAALAQVLKIDLTDLLTKPA